MPFIRLAICIPDLCPCTEERTLKITVKISNLLFQAVWVGKIVRILTGNISTGRKFYAAIQRGSQTQILLAY
jgi:hypothetical protein